MSTLSLSSRERRNPPPRRKSCAACIKAKRRCDFAYPSCIRCSQRDIPCEYPSGAIGRRRVHLPSPESPSTFDQVLAELPNGGGGGVPTAHSAGGLYGDGIESMAYDTPVAYHGVSPGASNSCVNAPFLDFARFNFAMDEDDMGLVYQTSMLTPPASKSLDYMSQIIIKRLQFSIDEIRKAPVAMVRDTQTPWCHPRLYEDGMPKSMQDAHASCALYMAKNRTNGPIIFRSIEAHVADLLSASVPLTAVDSLAHTQSLILYQIIRLLDGDIAARASAERHIAALETSALNLLSHVQFHDEVEPGSSTSSSSPSATVDFPLYPITQAKAFWFEWIFQESARRTLMFTFFFLQAYRVLSGQPHQSCDAKLGLCHSWTLSSHLWSAKSPVEFIDAFKGKKYFVVTNARFESVLDEARAADVDDFGKIWMTPAMGIEETEGWFASRGGSLRGPAQAC